MGALAHHALHPRIFPIFVSPIPVDRLHDPFSSHESCCMTTGIWMSTGIMLIVGSGFLERVQRVQSPL